MTDWRQCTSVDFAAELNRLLPDRVPRCPQASVGRDDLLRFWEASQLPLLTLSYPLPWLAPDTSRVEGMVFGEFPREDARAWVTNVDFAAVFIEATAPLPDTAVFLWADAFTEEPYERCYVIRAAEWQRFVTEVDLQFNFIGDIVLLVPDAKVLWVLFHHEQYHLLLVEGDPKRTYAAVRNEYAKRAGA